jgi:hypothetical protein
MAIRTETQLKEHGCDMSANQFQIFADAMFTEHGGYDALDEMLLHPDDAKKFCNTVRDQGREFASLPDDLILRSIIIYRKSGKKNQ